MIEMNLFLAIYSCTLEKNCLIIFQSILISLTFRITLEIYLDLNNSQTEITLRASICC